jgi:hypothetical protein
LITVLDSEMEHCQEPHTGVLMAPSKQKPKHEIRLGCIRAAIWANQTSEEVVWFNVTVSRLYKEGDVWKDTSSFCRDDLPVVAKVVDMADAWIGGQKVPAPTDKAVE